MERGWHYWLIEAEGALPVPVEDVDPKVFTSLDEARQAAKAVGRPIDLFRTPEQGGIWQFVETVSPDQKVPIGQAEETDSANVIKVTESDDLGISDQATTTVGKTLESRWNVESPTTIHIRQLWCHSPTRPGEPWRVEARDETGKVLDSGMGDPQDAYLALWESMLPPDEG